MSSTVASSFVSRRTLLRSLALGVPVAALTALVPSQFAQGGTVSSAATDQIEIIDAISRTQAATAGGYVKPTASNTGVPAGTALTVHRGDMVVTTPGTVIENLDVYGFIQIRAANVTVRKCRVRGTSGRANNTGLIDCNHTAVRNAVIEDCLLIPDFPSVWLTGVIGKEYTARRCDVSQVVDGFGAYNSSIRTDPTNVVIESNYIHDLSWFSSDPNHSDGTHNDGVQVQGGANVTIRGNNIQCFMSQTSGTQDYVARNIGQGILVQPNTAKIANVDVSYNWLDGGKVGIYMVLGNQPGSNYGRCEGNRFGRNQYPFNGNGTYQIRIKRGITFSNSLFSNVWDDNGVAFAEGTWKGIRYDA
jgi:hypothetical protein